MNILVILIPVSLFLGFCGLMACIWTLKRGQYDDLEGDAARILLDDDAPR
jgi:cbb3-type cytochrome oxidase maturation protein